MVIRPVSQTETLPHPVMAPTSQAISEVLEAQALEAALEPSQVSASISEHFAGLADPRKSGMVDHKLLDIITITVCAVICGANNWVEVAMYGQSAYFARSRQAISHDPGRSFRANTAARLMASQL